MTKKIDVTLSIRNKEFGTLPGWTTVTAENGDPYYYHYTGGTDGNGNVEVKKDKKAEITVTAGNDPRYLVNGVVVTNDPHGDITSSHSGQTATLSDSAKDIESNIYYKIEINDDVANTTFYCDPMIDNVGG